MKHVSVLKEKRVDDVKGVHKKGLNEIIPDWV